MSTVTVQNQNAFAQSPVIGQLDLTVNPNLKPVMIDPASVAGAELRVGAWFKIVDKAGPQIMVDIAGATDVPYGVLPYDSRTGVYNPGDQITLACRGSVVYLETSAAIGRGGAVQQDPTGPTVAPLAASNAKCGQCLDKPTGSGVLARIEVDPADYNTATY